MELHANRVIRLRNMSLGHFGKYDYARHGPSYAVESSTSSSSRFNKSSIVNIKSKSSTGNNSTINIEGKTDVAVFNKSNNTSNDNKLSGMRIQQLLDMYHPSRHSIPKNLQKKYTSAYMIRDFPRCSALLKTAKKIQRNEIRYNKQTSGEDLCTQHFSRRKIKSLERKTKKYYKNS